MAGAPETGIVDAGDQDYVWPDGRLGSEPADRLDGGLGQLGADLAECVDRHSGGAAFNEFAQAGHQGLDQRQADRRTDDHLALKAAAGGVQ